MRRMLAMFKIQVLQTVRDRGELVGLLVLPLLLTWVFGVAFGSGGADRPMLVLWLEGDTGIYAEEIRAIADAEESIEVQAATQAEATEKLDSGEAGLAVLVPEGFSDGLEAGEQVSIEVVIPPDSQRGQAAAEIVEGAVTRVSANVEAARVTAGAMEEAAARAAARIPPEMNFSFATPVPPSFETMYANADALWEPDPPVGVAGRSVVAANERGDSVLAESNIHYSVGFTLMFVLFVSFSTAQGILEERELGTLRRLLSTPASKPVILGGKSLGVIGVGAIEALILIGFGALFFGVPWGSDPLAVVLLMASYVLAAAGLAVFVTAIVRTRDQLSAAGPIAATALAMLGGCYWPIEITPPTMQMVAKFTPTGWGMTGLLDVVARHQGIEAALLPAAVLLGMGALFFGIGLAVLKVE